MAAGTEAPDGSAATMIAPLPPGGSLARLVGRTADGGEVVASLDPVSTVGRQTGNTVRLDDSGVSKQHAVLERRDDGWRVRDLRSSNGTFVNGERIEEAPLEQGDELLFGTTRLFFDLAEPPRAADEPADGMVTILDQGGALESYIQARIEGQDDDFRPADEVSDLALLKRDYEKLRVAHLLSRVGITTDLPALLDRILDTVFAMLEPDNAVIMLVDEETKKLVPHAVRRRHPAEDEGESQGIVLSETIVNAAVEERASILSSDAFVDPRFFGAESVVAQGIRAAMCVPLVTDDRVLGLMHIDSRERAGAFVEKDLQILGAIAAQATAAIENARLIRQSEEEERTRAQLSRFLPPHVVEEMVEGRGAPITKGGREVEASVVFCDIRGFTALSETQEPQEVVDLLNDYFERLVEIVFDRGGVLDKFIGDALMASWGTLAHDGDLARSARDAVAAALDFREAIRRLNVERQAAGGDPIRMGVGVNTGRLVAGYMGARRRLEYTVIGDTVNTASRLCGLAAGDQVLISESTHELVREGVEARFLGARQVKGKAQEVGVYELSALVAGC